MPYIPSDGIRRATLNPATPKSPVNAGELNFQFTKLCIAYVEENGLKYQSINDIVGALEGCKAEFQRRVASWYEDSKIESNGDVYPADLTATQAAVNLKPMSDPCFDAYRNVVRHP